MDKRQLDGLLALKLVAESGHFTAAAKILGVSPSAVSQMIKQLEERVGVALLSRTTRSTSLTEAGARFMAEAGVALDQILVAMENVRSFAAKPAGTLKVTLPRAVYPAFLSHHIASFTEKYPEITLELHFEDEHTDIVGRGFDCGIRLADVVARDMVALKLYGPVQFVVAGAPRYFRQHDRPRHPRDLLHHQCIRPRSGSWIYDSWEFVVDGKEVAVQVSGSLIFSDTLLMLDAACRGTGLVFATADMVSQFVAEGRLETVLGEFTIQREGFYLYYPHRAQVLPKLRAFIDHLRAARLAE